MTYSRSASWLAIVGRPDACHSTLSSKCGRRSPSARGTNCTPRCCSTAADWGSSTQGTYTVALVLLFVTTVSLWATLIFPVWVLAVSILILVQNYRRRTAA